MDASSSAALFRNPHLNPNPNPGLTQAHTFDPTAAGRPNPRHAASRESHMDKLLITGGTPLHGEVRISGAKNAALPILAATLLTAEPVTLTNVPCLRDIATTKALLGRMGVRLTDDGAGSIRVDAGDITGYAAPYDLVKT
ncbi:MAG TPA: hypothetical protein VLM84_13035, partial [Chromatiaceae bacterium]|nr:hypothetical protein [Chromatiaceae bacterium]